MKSNKNWSKLIIVIFTLNFFYIGNYGIFTGSTTSSNEKYYEKNDIIELVNHQNQGGELNGLKTKKRTDSNQENSNNLNNQIESKNPIKSIKNDESIINTNSGLKSELNEVIEEKITPEKTYLRNKISNKKDQSNRQFKLTQNYIEHSPIIIDGNTDFHSQASTEGWNQSGTRDGTLSKPYLIDGINITAGVGVSNLIFIQNTDVYFEISNAYFLNSWSTGIYFNNVANGKILHSMINNTDGTGIYFRDSVNNTIDNNTIINTENGIVLSDSPNNIITNNNLIFSSFNIGGFTVPYYLQKDVSNNLVNGKPFIFLTNTNGVVISEEAGQIFMV
jgi:parallel beta-helix repeat protein